MVSQTHQNYLDRFLALLSQQAGVLVQVDAVEGSVPREAGTWMAVFADTLVGTVGGGHLEYEAIATAREMLKRDGVERQVKTMRYALGPALGQCCGGVVHLRFEPVSARDMVQLRQRLHPMPRRDVGDDASQTARREQRVARNHSDGQSRALLACCNHRQRFAHPSTAPP